jgi:hypothetical protein
MWSFNRLTDSSKIEKEDIIWNGPYSLPGFEEINGFDTMADVAGVYLFTFKYKDGFLIYLAGITNSTKRRLLEHLRAYKTGKYTVLDVKSAENGLRKEIWHGWQYAKSHQKEFIEQKETILEAAEKQLCSFRIFIAEVTDERKRERIEAAIMQYIYNSKEHWSKLADRGMHLQARYKYEMPIEAKNINLNKIFGLTEILEF